MQEKSYPWKGWKMPIFDLGDPEYCEYGCPVCRAARQGNPLAKAAQKVELLVTLGNGCPWGVARKKKYGVTPDQPIPKDD